MATIVHDQERPRKIITAGNMMRRAGVWAVFHNTNFKFQSCLCQIWARQIPPPRPKKKRRENGDDRAQWFLLKSLFLIRVIFPD